MKILLLGEFSGLFNCLKDGLIELGHEVFLASDGDKYKNYDSDFRWDKHYNGKFKSIYSIFNLFSNIKLFKGFDIVLIISPQISNRAFINNRIFDYLIKNNNKVFLSGAGLNPYSFDYWNSNKDTKYYNYTQGEISSANKQNKKFSLDNNVKLKKSELNLFERINGYIPIMYEYAEPYRGFPKLIKTIPIPINLGKLEYKTNSLNKKLVFFHGLTRECKGGDFILKAFDSLSKKYPNDAEFFAKGGLPFDEYMQLIQKTNVILDDVNAYSLGMNGLFSMAKGKIVMGGAEDVANKELNYSFCPAINLKRDVNQIIFEIEKIIENRKNIEELGYQSRLFVEKHHDHINIAKKYLDLWK